ncbi:hypothetical protein SAMN05444410_1234 [Hydrobacter penzbergensis]|uniref:Uncharacterized protein n=1 Tax=Hydrobacter penzbergensis TaxID=1235997 RepID=A0A8X8IG06_9BACT|nr:hypothetical protein [Hydrobacter penzbergensis]SDX64838.1 hypothetical protein SAMN05444410_1234 [Hydrobacter penzbergensis]
MKQIRKRIVNEVPLVLFFLVGILLTTQSNAQSDSSIKNQISVPQTANFWHTLLQEIWIGFHCFQSVESYQFKECL